MEEHTVLLAVLSPRPLSVERAGVDARAPPDSWRSERIRRDTVPAAAGEPRLLALSHAASAALARAVARLVQRVPDNHVRVTVDGIR